MEELINKLDYIHGIFNEYTVCNGEVIEHKNTIEITPELRTFVTDTLVQTMELLIKKNN
jgi:hypothetical protein